jgi:hypothetical protein
MQTVLVVNMFCTTLGGSNLYRPREVPHLRDACRELRKLELSRVFIGTLQDDIVDLNDAGHVLVQLKDQHGVPFDLVLAKRDIVSTTNATAGRTLRYRRDTKLYSIE